MGGAVSLLVTHAGKTAKVAAAHGRAGLNEIAWNRKLLGKRAGRGLYTLTLTVTSAGKTTRSTITARS